jgi:hypothetical protein
MGAAAAEGMGMYPPPPGAAGPLLGRRQPNPAQHTDLFTSIGRKEKDKRIEGTSELVDGWLLRAQAQAQAKRAATSKLDG